MRCVHLEQEMEVTLYFAKTTGWSSDDMDDLASDLETWWETFVAPDLSSECSLTSILVTELSTSTGLQINHVPAAPIAGGDETGTLPPQDAMVITFITLLRGRSFRGRNYMFGFTEQRQNGGRWSAGIQEVYQLAYDQLSSIATANDASWVVVSRYSGVDPVTKKPVPRETGFKTQISSVRVNEIVATQRRRRLGVGG